MSVRELRQAFEAIVELGNLSRRHCRPPALATVPTIDPGGGKTDPFCRHVIMPEALRDVQDAGLLDSEVFLEAVKEVREILGDGLYDPMSCAV